MVNLGPPVATSKRDLGRTGDGICQEDYSATGRSKRAELRAPAISGN